MQKKVSKLNAHVRKSYVPALPQKPAKVLPLEAWRIASIESWPPPAAHFGCVDWYMYEQSGERDAPIGSDRADGAVK
jgi:hypothetical protein